MTGGARRLVARQVDTVRAVPQALWDEKIAAGHPLKTAAFFACIEDAFPERRFTYLVLSSGDEVVGLAVVTEERLDLSLVLPRWTARAVRWIRALLPGLLTLRVGMVGTFETAERHWWYDPTRVALEEFAAALLATCEAACARSSLLLVRDLDLREPADAALQSWLRTRGFTGVDNLPLAVVALDGLGLDAHTRRLKKKSRQTIRKAIKEAEAAGLALERVDAWRHLLDACYPLYLQVHAGAVEFRRPPLPPAFFAAVCERLVDSSSLLTLRAADGALVAFVLSGTSPSLHNPFLLGMDYARTRDTPAYQRLLWAEVEYAAARGCRIVDLGLTSYFVKQTAGAELKPLTMAARVRAGWLRPLVGPLLPRLLGAEQPPARRRFRVEAGAEQQPSEE